jgi:hypothetical protein
MCLRRSDDLTLRSLQNGKCLIENLSNSQRVSGGHRRGNGNFLQCDPRL